MLRITTIENTDQVLLKLEGKLSGAWVVELETCWREIFAKLGERSLLIDLTGVQSMDAAGRCTLALIHMHGTQLIASGCGAQMIQDIIDHWPVRSATESGKP